MKKNKKRANILKLVFIAAGVIAAIAAIGAIVAAIKKKAEQEKQREAEVEEEIRAILEEKLAQTSCDTCGTAEVEECH